MSQQISVKSHFSHYWNFSSCSNLNCKVLRIFLTDHDSLEDLLIYESDFLSKNDSPNFEPYFFFSFRVWKVQNVWLSLHHSDHLLVAMFPDKQDIYIVLVWSFTNEKSYMLLKKTGKSLIVKDTLASDSANFRSHKIS